MEAIIGWIMNTTTSVEVMQTMFDRLSCRFILYILLFWSYLTIDYEKLNSSFGQLCQPAVNNWF
jgi:hypothetical protein